jgi:hypothetical protein
LWLITPWHQSAWTTFCRPDNLAGVIVLSNWVTVPTFTYTANDTAPDQDPADGRLWYYSSVDDVDIMIQNNGAWVGYQNVTNDTRGFNLTLTNASGPIVAATAPTTQNDTAESPLQYGDLWIDSSDLGKLSIAVSLGTSQRSRSVGSS